MSKTILFLIRIQLIITVLSFFFGVSIKFENDLVNLCLYIISAVCACSIYYIIKKFHISEQNMEKVLFIQNLNLEND